MNLTKLSASSLILKLLCPILLATGVSISQASTNPEIDFLRVKGENIVDSNGQKFFIKGTNLGNWVNPEGYMFGFSKANSYGMINDLICQLLGPAEASRFWQTFRDKYITEEDIAFIASQGANTIRFPFHYKLFTDEPYMGSTSAEEGFSMLDKLIGEARDNNLRLILDMHDCPGGQTGDNIDDSFGYPFLMTDETSQEEYINLWVEIAKRYKDELTILGYELMNEPIATYWEGEERDKLNDALMPLYRRTVEAIRTVDPNHIILLGGAQWNSNFEPLTDWSFDDNIMFTCHRYGGDASAEAIRSFIEFRDKTGLPMYMGEIGHNTTLWQETFSKVMEDNNIGYTFWPYKKINDSAMTGIKTPDNWQMLVDFAEAPRGTFSEIRKARENVDIEKVKKALYDYIDGASAEKMLRHEDYIKSMRLK